MIIDIKQAAVGKWASINAMLGIDQKYFNGKHQDCPICKDGKDRFRWNKQTEYAHCNQCGSLSGIDLAIAFTGKSFREIAPEIKQNYLGIATMTVTPEFNDSDLDKNKRRLEGIHKTLSVLGKHTDSLQYLGKRGLSVMPDKDCYFSTSVPYYEDGKKVGDYQALCSAFRNIAGEMCSYHVTYIDKGNKADVSSPKKILPSIRKLSGSAIQLFNPVDGVIGVAEGIETALAVHELEGLPMWATGNAQLMMAMEFPEGLKQLHIYADSDKSFTGQNAAYSLARRAVNAGIEVRVNLLVDQDWLVDSGVKYDFLDYLILKKYEEKKQVA